ncbi:PadR family transcriptional regulator [Myceligenerans indicum]|uniref:PadR family transcriptional regulator n=1 Tax=Myceligenerans indicum TaxID=2593663 RepID=A0ABS1LN30_9MICO|nr:PadR family transcriptional regulator [Myceligenerans indicum]MBL0887677.1 PadR family transcriptional regulator [Myceligenerans indicum]
MSVRHALLVLLSERPMHGYQLRQEFERRTGGTWPLNIGQAYSTLSRLERDGLVAPVGSDDPDAPETYRLTDDGTEQARSWWDTPVDRGTPARDELAIKLALAVTVRVDGKPVDVPAIVQRQRTATMTVLRDLTRLKREAGDDLAWSLVLDSLVFAAEAEIRWLDHVEASVVRAARQHPERAEQGAPAPSSATARKTADRKGATR